MKRIAVYTVIVFYSLCAYSICAHAVLGERAESIASDQRSMAAFSVRPTTHDAFTVRTLQSDAGVVREYISPSGIVFAIAWSGLNHPDLSPLLGSYDSEYQNALDNEQRVLGRRSRAVRGNRVVVEKWGHMRSLAGRAYDPSLLPGGMTVEEIQ